MKPHSLNSRISLTFALLILLFGGLCAGLDLVAARNHQQEIIQKLSRGLAEHIAGHWPVTNADVIDHKAIADLFHMLMVVNPSVEFYLLDSRGTILAYDAPPGRVRLQHVDLAPVRAFLDGATLPLRGDNPRHPEQRQIFSATALQAEGKTMGYLYIVLAGDAYQSLADPVWQGHVFQMALAAGAGSLLLTLLTGLALFAAITRRLNTLTCSVASFEDPEAGENLGLDQRLTASPDEIGQLARAFTRMAERIAAQMRQIRSQDEQRREMVANVSHDLRTPLTAMQGYLETLLRKSGQLSAPEQEQYLRVAVRQSRRVSHLAQELFELAKLECEEVQPSLERFSLQELVQDVAHKFGLAADQKQIRISAQFVEDIPLVCADIAMIERVLSNLIDNALRHTPEGGEIRIELSCSEERGVIVKVADTGSGIAEEHLPGLFERDSPLRRSPERTRGGLGLLITQRILQLHGSSIEALRGQERGAAFAFSLPTAAPA